MKVVGKPLHVEQFDTTIDGVFIKRIPLKEGVIVPQHAHSHSHATIIGSGFVRVWKDKKWWGDFHAGKVLNIEAKTMHEFLALKDSELYCIHNEEHALVVAENKLEFI